jgi:hypothetical protein
MLLQIALLLERAVVAQLTLELAVASQNSVRIALA